MYSQSGQPFIHEHVGDASKLNGSLDYWYKNVVMSILVSRYHRARLHTSSHEYVRTTMLWSLVDRAGLMSEMSRSLSSLPSKPQQQAASASSYVPANTSGRTSVSEESTHASTFISTKRVVDAAHARPSPYSSTLKTGKPGSGLARPGAVSLNAYSTSTAAQVLDQGNNTTHPWRSMDDCVADMLTQFGQHGWGL
jgi:hypothetical protein